MLATDVLTYHNNNARTGAVAEAILNSLNVTPEGFGKLGVFAVPNASNAQPLFKTGVTIPGKGVHDVLIVTTRTNLVYALDAGDGSVLWSTRLFATSMESSLGLAPTPVIDDATGTIYAVAGSLVFTPSPPAFPPFHTGTGQPTLIPHVRIYALDVETGGFRFTPTDLAIGLRSVTAALTLANGIVYTTWGTGTAGSGSGWIVAFDPAVGIVASRQINADGSGGGFSNSGAGPAANGLGVLTTIAGKGTFDPSAGDYGNSVLRIERTDPDTLGVSPSFALPTSSGLDFGTSGVALVQTKGERGSPSFTEVITAGPDGSIYAIKQDGGLIQEVTGALGGPIFGAPTIIGSFAYFGAAGSTVKGFMLNLASSPGGGLQDSPLFQTANAFGAEGAGLSGSGNILWAVDGGANPVLYAYDAFNLSRTLYSSETAANGRDHIGSATTFATPTIANGRVYVATKDGIQVFGLLPTQPPPTILIAHEGYAGQRPITGLYGELFAFAQDANFPGSELTYVFTTVAAPPGAPPPGIVPANRGAAFVAFGAAGAYTFQVTVTDPAGRSSSLRFNAVVAQTASRIAIAPTAATVPAGRSLRFSATALDQFGTPLVTPPVIGFGLFPGGVGVAYHDGLYVAPAAGTGSALVVAATGSLVATAAVTVVVPPVATIEAHVNFTADPGQTPAGYLSDTGGTLALRDGLIFGWNRDNSANAVDRDDPTAPDELRDSFVAMQRRPAPNASWTIFVPNGVYSVRLVAGDPGSIVGNYRMKVNGVLALQGVPTAARRSLESTVFVRVTNGRITVSNAPGARDNKLAAIDLVQLAPARSVAASARPTGPRALRAGRR